MVMLAMPADHWNNFAAMVLRLMQGYLEPTPWRFLCVHLRHACHADLFAIEFFSMDRQYSWGLADGQAELLEHEPSMGLSLSNHDIFLKTPATATRSGSASISYHLSCHSGSNRVIVAKDGVEQKHPHGIGVSIISSGWKLLLCGARSDEGDPFSDRELKILGELAPHAERLFTQPDVIKEIASKNSVCEYTVQGKMSALEWILPDSIMARSTHHLSAELEISIGQASLLILLAMGYTKPDISALLNVESAAVDVCSNTLLKKLRIDRSSAISSFVVQHLTEARFDQLKAIFGWTCSELPGMVEAKM
jgi:hypothetical protein